MNVDGPWADLCPRIPSLCAELPEKEIKFVGGVFYLFAYRGSSGMAGQSFIAEQYGAVRRGSGGLQARRHFARVQRGHASITVAAEGEHRGIFCPRLNVVIGRVGVEIF